MAKQTKKKSRKNKTRRSVSQAQPPRRRRDGKAALRGMLIGIGVLSVLAFLSFVRIGGDTPIMHLLNMFESPVESSEAPVRKTSTKPQKQTKPSPPKNLIKKLPKAAKAKPPKVSGNAEQAPPLETLTDSDKAGLDELIKSKGK
ncbi:MAG: hypothetical protein CMH52_00185 [Myxococcales bacterium]|nr:hypothetical protein [Myxococcales bacterium]|tara:strand:- start:236 stop:667 length:432 start_codon:yes stop_codon:yes gene_type:complete